MKGYWEKIVWIDKKSKKPPIVYGQGVTELWHGYKHTFNSFQSPLFMVKGKKIFILKIPRSDKIWNYLNLSITSSMWFVGKYSGPKRFRNISTRIKKKGGSIWGSVNQKIKLIRTLPFPRISIKCDLTVLLVWSSFPGRNEFHLTYFLGSAQHNEHPEWTGSCGFLVLAFKYDCISMSVHRNTFVHLIEIALTRWQRW